MSSVPTDPIKFFHSQFPDIVLRSICRGIDSAHITAEAYFKDNAFTPEQRHDALPGLRRAHVERNTISVLGRYSNVKVTTLANTSGNAFHNRIACGRVFLTISAVTSPSEMVREAAFRQTYAFSQNLDLFTGRSEPTADSSLYGIVLHGPAARPATEEAWAEARKQGLRFDRPAFIQIAFPDQELRAYLTEPINLLARFPDLFRDDEDGGQIEKPKAPVLSPVPEVGTDK